MEELETLRRPKQSLLGELRSAPSAAEALLGGQLAALRDAQAKYLAHAAVDAAAAPGGEHGVNQSSRPALQQLEAAPPATSSAVMAGGGTSALPPLRGAVATGGGGSGDGSATLGGG